MMVFKLAKAAEQKWRRINAPSILGKVAAGVTLVNDEEQQPQELAA
jgi:ribosomal protein S3AE